jgi:hypothetical protein
VAHRRERNESAKKAKHRSALTCFISRANKEPDLCLRTRAGTASGADD